MLLHTGIDLHPDKEQWEILMPIIFRKVPLVEEMWTIDEQNHGESAILNDEALKTRPIGKSRLEPTCSDIHPSQV
jgi:hypothetical protein